MVNTSEGPAWSGPSLELADDDGDNMITPAVYASRYTQTVAADMAPKQPTWPPRPHSTNQQHYAEKAALHPATRSILGRNSASLPYIAAFAAPMA